MEHTPVSPPLAAPAIASAGATGSPALASPPRDVVLGRQRRNGFERPFSRDQVISCAGHAASAVCFYVAVVGLLVACADRGADRLFVLSVSALAVHVAAVALLVASWRSCESIDPAKHVDEVLPNGWLGVKLRGPRWDKTRYCALCRKAVPGLDHHCTWLQTCVGQANYAQFFTVAVTGTVQFVVQVGYGVAALLWLELWLEDALWASAPEVYSVLEAFLVATTLLSVPCMFMYFVLLGFHVYLMCLGYGTYEWMLRRRKQQRAKAEAKKAAAKTSTAGGSEASTVRASDAEEPRHASRHTSSVGSTSEFVSVDASELSQSARELTAL